jgi:hypothetical protein
MTNEQQRSPIFRLDRLKKHLYNTIWGIKQLLMRSASREGEAQAQLLPQPGRARLPRPLGLHAAAPIVKVACSSPDS